MDLEEGGANHAAATDFDMVVALDSTTPVLPATADDDPPCSAVYHFLTEQDHEPDQDGFNLLRYVFGTMAIDGKVTRDQLPFLLMDAEVHVSPEEITRVIEAQIPDADDADDLLDFDQVQGLYQQLLQSINLDAHLEEGTGTDTQPCQMWWKGVWSRWKQYRQRKKAQKIKAYDRQMKPTTRLLLAIMTISCLISIAVLLFAVVYIWDHNNATLRTHMVRDMELMRDAMDFFGYTNLLKRYETNIQHISSLLAIAIEDLGYKMDKKRVKSDLQYEGAVLGSLLDGWHERRTVNTVKTKCTMMRVWLEYIIATQNIAAAIQMVDELNPTLPAGHEIVLSQVNSTTHQPTFLTQLRYRHLCQGECGRGSTTALPTRAALARQTGTMFGDDYQPTRVAAAYTYLPNSDIGLVYKVDIPILQDEFQHVAATSMNEINNLSSTLGVSEAGLPTSERIVVGTQVTGQPKILSALNGCNADCLTQASTEKTILTPAFQNQSSVVETKDFDGSDIIAAYSPVPSSGMALMVKVEMQELSNGLVRAVGPALDYINSGLHGSEEIQFATLVSTNTSANASTTDLQFSTAFRFPGDCEGPCATAPNTSSFLRTAIENCSHGVVHGTDYRNTTVIAGFACIAPLQARLVFKLDYAEAIRDGISTAASIATYQNKVRFANKSFEIIVAKKKAGVVVAHSARDFTRITVLKHRKDCPNMTCVGPSTQITRALNHQTGVLRGPDYRNVTVIGAYAYIESLDVGVVVKVDAAEEEAESVTLTLNLFACSFSTVIFSMVVLAVLSHLLLRSLDRTWEEGKQAVEREKQQFISVIEAMYPAQVAQRLLVGETQIVYNVPEATVFFSDVYEFTTISNTLTAEELIRFMGYTFGVMDAVADHYHIHKVKTIGDAYLAVAGLPGSKSLSTVGTLDMAMFASCCAQVFSSRYLHPDEGNILRTVTFNLFGRKTAGKTGAVSGGNNLRLPHTTQQKVVINDNMSTSTGQSSNPTPPPVQCVMRYGIATGSITAGVLQGKTPLFDIWGKTVNLASRMESTGTPGRIQVSEGAHRILVAQRGQPFTFESKHKVFCKGFGNVNAYFISTCSASPPKDLLARLKIQPDLGHFHFDSQDPNGSGGSKPRSVRSGSCNGSSTRPQSAHSSVSSTGRHGAQR